MTSNKNTHRFLPLILAVGIVIGIFVGDFYRGYFSNPNLSVVSASSSKITDILMLINDHYAEEVDIPEIVEKAIPHILCELDPHSTYSSAEDVEADMQNIEGHFYGIGIQFYVYRDTINVVKILPGGPSEGKNIKPGDRIVAVDGKNITGENSSSDSVVKKLKGPEGSNVALDIVRYESGQKHNVNLNLTRGEVPLKSINVYYMLNKEVGYICISSFASNTYEEFLYAMQQLEARGMKKLVLDLRGNLGGYLESSVQIANEFLPKNRLIVYIEGRKTTRQNFNSDGKGLFQNMPLMVIVDEYSASASEVFAGAMQDNDRATIIGRRTFGKGLVQEPLKLRDGSVVRLTKARYFTPSGRCVQKPYTKGAPEEEYAMDLVNREYSGELFHADSIKTNGKIYHTHGGRNVYGGGGIIPDEFVPLDTLGYTPYYSKVASRGLLQEFAYYYVDQHRSVLTKQNDLKEYLKTDNLLKQFEEYAERNGLPANADTKRSSRIIQRMITWLIIDDISSSQLVSTKFKNEDDATIQKALRLLK